VYQARRKHDHCPTIGEQENKNKTVYVILSADNTSIPVNDHEVSPHKGEEGEEKECQENLEVQPSKHGDPESMLPNGSEVRPQNELVTKYEAIMTRSRAKKNTSIMF
jgi:hypothetical protein